MTPLPTAAFPLCWHSPTFSSGPIQFTSSERGLPHLADFPASPLGPILTGAVIPGEASVWPRPPSPLPACPSLVPATQLSLPSAGEGEWGLGFGYPLLLPSDCEVMSTGGRLSQCRYWGCGTAGRGRARQPHPPALQELHLPHRGQASPICPTTLSKFSWKTSFTSGFLMGSWLLRTADGALLMLGP